MKNKLPEWIPLVGKKAKKLGLETDVLGNLRQNFDTAIDEHLEKNGANSMREFSTGAHRDSGGKFDFVEYMSTLAMCRYGKHMRKNAVKYGSGNWLKGIPREEYMKSLRRHLWMLDIEEQTGIKMEPGTDHLAACMFNVMGALHEDGIEELKNGLDTLAGYPIDKTNFKRNDKQNTE